MRLRHYILLAMVVVSGEAARGEPTSITFYSVDRNDPYAPVVKQTSVKPAEGYLRDPNIDSVPLAVNEQPKKPSRKSQLSYTKKKHGFAPAKIKGSLRVPRVAFAQESLELTKIPDELPKAFLDKPFTPDATNY